MNNKERANKILHALHPLHVGDEAIIMMPTEEQKRQLPCWVSGMDRFANHKAIIKGFHDAPNGKWAIINIDNGSYYWHVNWMRRA